MAATTASTVYASAALTHIGSGASLATLTISGSADVSTALSSANLLRYPEADVTLFFNHTATMNPASTSIALYRRDINVDGTGDEPIPNTVAATLYKAKFMGTFQVQPYSATSASYAQYAQLLNVPLADQCEFYIENLTNTSILAGWTLKVLPKSTALA